MTEHDALYEALVHFEDASNNVGTLTICTQGCYRTLTDAISGHGNVSEARVAFEFEAKLLADAHTQWAGCAAVLLAAVSDGQQWQSTFTIPHKRCVQCGNQQRPGDVWLRATCCNECVADGHERAEHAGNPFEEVARQRYGERGVLATEDI